MKAVLAALPGWKPDKDVVVACLEYFRTKADLGGAEEFIKLLGDRNIIPVNIQERLLNQLKNEDSNAVVATLGLNKPSTFPVQQREWLKRLNPTLLRTPSSLRRLSPDEAFSVESPIQFLLSFRSPNVPGISLYSTAAKSPPTSIRRRWKGSLNRLYGRISRITDPKAPIHLILDQWIEGGGAVDKVASSLSSRSSSTLIASTTLFRFLCGCLTKAEATMQKIRDLGLARTSLAYNNLLNLYHQTRNRDKLDALVNEMEAKGIRCDKFTYGIRLGAYACFF
ncbi:hypothetical protein M0R45_000094 [Rubus argutus]|uniref:Pentatricopeptide repeat-containing protein n=1 Tax=Rubus argutus TaxID=59490 RepID=A0AAW1VPC8_RUBAR